MSKYLTPSILILIALALFFVYIKPAYSRIGDTRVEEERFNELLSRSNELKDLRDDLLEEFNSFSSEDVERLTRFLPDNVDNIKLLIELDGIATRHGMVVRDVTFDDQREVDNEFMVQNEEIGKLSVGFTVSSSYDRFVDFLADLEQSLRLVDVDSIRFEIGESENFTEYNVTLTTYWLPVDEQ